MSALDPSQPQPVAIIGIGCLFPKANGPGAYWANVCNRVDAITDVPPTHWRPEDYFDPDPKAPDRVYAARGGFLTPVDFPPLEFGISPNTLEATDSTQLLGLLVARQALADAGYAPPRDFDRSRVGVILGVTGTLELVIPLGARLGHPHWRRALQEAGVPDEVAEKVVQRIADSYVGWQEDSFPGLLGNVAAGRIANRLDLGGTNCVVDAACASSLGAIHLALLELQSGRADLVVSGGLDTFNDVFMYTCFCKTPALSPTGNARPFDKNADGTILGEGLGVLVLKRHADAVRDGDRVYALIRGIGSSSDGKGNAIYAPNPAGQAKALRQAYRLAGVTPDTIELVEAHGTGTRAGDAAEVAALTEVYRAGPRAGSWCALGSVKSQIGHTKAAAGVAGVIKAALSLHHKVLPPTIKVEQPIDAVAPGRTPFYVNTEKRPWLPAASHPRRAAVSAFGFGGSNFHCVLEENDPDKPVIDWDERYEILAVAADSHEEIHSRLEALNAGLSWEALKVEAARSRAEFSSDRLFRLVLVLEEGQDLAQTLETARTLLEKQRGRKTWSSPDRIYFGSGAPAGKLAFLFPGQGSQYVGMLRDLACRFPAMLQALADANFDTGAGQRLSDRIYPPPAFTDADRTAQEQALRATDVAQPALGAVSLGALRVLEHFGVAAEALAGHSYGELVALCAAGRIDATALHSLSQTRGRLMAGVAGDAGTMLAVQAPREQVEQVLRDQALELVVANRNAPRQFVLSGTKAAVGRAQETFARLNVPARLLPVAAAFHSPLVAAVQAPFLDLLAKVEIDPGAAPVFANTTGRQYPADAQDVRSLLAEQLARPVEFIEEIEAMFRAGVRTFLEVGPGQKLTGLVRSILDGKDHEAFSVDASAGKRAGALDLAAALAQLAALGHRAELARWLAGREPKPERTANRAALTIPICGANYVRPRPAAKPEKGPVMHDGKNGDGSATKNGEAQARPAVSRAISAAPRPAQAPAGDASAFAQALKATQDNLLALQKLGEQSAQLHRQFLDGQDKVLHAFQALLQQQQQMVQVSLGLAPPRGDAATRGHGDTAIEEEQPVPASPCPRVPASPCPQPPPTPQAEQLPSGSDFEHAKSVLLEVVAEKTGYPAEMLELDMELDSDLGIDSIKRVEIFSALQERLPEAPAVKPEHLGSLRTLRQVVDFLRQQTLTEPEPAAPPQNGHAPSVAPQASSRRDTGRVVALLLQVVAEKTGYPGEMLELDMELDSDLGIDSIKRVEIFSTLQEQMPDAPAVKPEHLGALRTLRQVADFITGTASENVASAEKPSDESMQMPNGQSPAEEAADSVSAAELPLQCFELELRNLDSGAARPAVALPAGGEIWLTDDGAGLAEAVAGRLSALGCLPRTISLADTPKAPPDALAGLILLAPARAADDAFLRDAFLLVQSAGPALRKSGGVLLTVSRLDGAFGLEGMDGDPTGGGLAGLAKTAAKEWPEVRCKALDVAVSLTDPDEAALAIVEEMSLAGPAEVGITRDGKRTLGLKELMPGRPQPPPVQAGEVIIVTGGARGVTAEVAHALARAFAPTLVMFGRSPEPAGEPPWLTGLIEEGEIKRALLTQAGGRASPREIGEQYQRVAAAREIRRSLDRLRALGVQVVYRSVDVRDAQAVRAALAEVQAEVGPVKGLVHGAGVLADRKIEEKTAEQFERVYATKVAGLRNLLAELDPQELKLLILFSSSTARFGRAGQVDYAVANEVLNKMAQQHARRHPGCRVLSVNWGPWDGGMVTPALKQVFANEGIGVIPLAAGAEFLVRQLRCAPGCAPEVVVLGKPVPKAAPAEPARPLAVAFERELSLENCPVLRSHVLDGRAVLPLVLSLEWLAHGAIHRNPGLAFHGFNDLRALKGVRLAAGQSSPIRVLAGKPRRDGGCYLVPAELHAAKASGEEFLCARAEIVLAEALPDAAPMLRGEGLAPYRRERLELYDEILFHGADLQGIELVEGCSAAGIAGTVATAPAPTAWLRQPLRTAWLADPLALDSAFQLMVLWCAEQQGAVSLPCHVGRYRQFRRAFPREGVRVVARVTEHKGQLARADIEFLDLAGQLVARMENYECVIDPALNPAFRRNRLAESALSV